MSSLVQRISILRRAKKRLSWRALNGGLHRGVEIMNLDQLEDSRRPLLFSLLPRMLRPDGSTPRLLQRAFGYSDQSPYPAPAMTVSIKRWGRALATSCKLAAGRARGREQ